MLLTIVAVQTGLCRTWSETNKTFFFSQLAWLHKYLMMFLHFEVGSTDLTENPACVVLVLGEIREIVDGALTVVL